MLIRKIEYSAVNKSSTFFRFFPPVAGGEVMVI
jgi:hypothetical protein